MTGVIAGEVQVLSSSAAALTPHIKSGKVRALAVTSGAPSPLLPGLPTVASAGLPGFDISSRTGIFASGKPPKPIIERLNKEIVRAVKTPEIREKFTSTGIETNTDTPEEATVTLKSEVARIAKVVKNAGIKGD